MIYVLFLLIACDFRKSVAEHHEERAEVLAKRVIELHPKPGVVCFVLDSIDNRKSPSISCLKE